MANKFEEFKQLSGTWNDNFFQRLEIFTKGLNNNKKFSYRNQLVTAQISPILSQITDTVFNYEHLYILLRSVFHLQSALTQTDLHNKLATQERDVQAKEAFKCYLLMAKFNSTIPADIRDQKLIAGIFRLDRLEAPLNQFLGELGARIADKFKIKDEEIDTLKNTVADLERVVTESVKKEEAGDELGRQKDEEINTLKNTVADLEKVVEENVKKEKEVVELTRRKDGEIKELNGVIKGMEDEFKASEQANKNLKTENATLTQKTGKLQETIKNKEKMIEREQSKYSSLRASHLQEAVNKQCNDRYKKLHQEQLDKLTTKFENILKKNANKMVNDSIEEVKVMRDLSQFKQDIQLQKLNFKDATFLKDQNNIDLNRVNNESTKRKGNTVLPVVTKRARSS